MKNKSLPSNQQGFVNIGLALGISLVVVAFLAPLGLYYVNMANQNEKARLKTQAQEVVEGVGKMIYSAYSIAPNNSGANCPAGTSPAGGSSGTYKKKVVDVSRGQNRLSISLGGKNKNMSGVVSGQLLPSDKPASDAKRAAFCLPTEGNCMTLDGRSYCFNFGDLEIAGNNIIDLPVHSQLENPTLLDYVRGHLVDVAHVTSNLVDKGFGSWKQGSLGGVASADALVAPVAGAMSFGTANLPFKGSSCQNTSGDPAALTSASSRSNYCVSCAENAVVCVRYSMCVQPGSSVATPARRPQDCSNPRHFLQGMIAMFPDRI